MLSPSPQGGGGGNCGEHPRKPPHISLQVRRITPPLLLLLLLLLLSLVDDWTNITLLSITITTHHCHFSPSPPSPLTRIASPSVAPNGFINIHLSQETLHSAVAGIVHPTSSDTPTATEKERTICYGVCPPRTPRQRVLVDFSSPNVAKEMHVGHLRSTIIGDAVCRVLEFCGHDVMRVNHVGDWGTQFGMLLEYMFEKYPDVLTQPPNISDLTLIYKAAKARFDEDEEFKTKARLRVVSLQGGDEACKKVWLLLCEVSRNEFQKVYNLLDVTLDEVGESFYNPLIPGVITTLQENGLVEDDQGMKIIKLKHFNIPLIVRKSDGGYGYDSTDMAAIHYRLYEKQADWIIYITDAGQADHFYMCFDAARAAGWVEHQRLDHIGFGVVTDPVTGKRFKTRSGEVVKLIDLINEGKTRMADSLRERAKDGKTPLSDDDGSIEHAASIIGTGAIKYADLKNNPATDYAFSYDKMLSTQGDTAVYLLFAYARVASILRKANTEKGKDLSTLMNYDNALNILNAYPLTHPAERALAFELMQLGDVIRSVLKDLLPNRLCDYLKALSVRFTDFVSKCNVLHR